ncbi:LysM peptidoglycan-binding domain-containing protein [uncultured Dialister sp.]|uniref:LysM peptidoglycan-binding domain-containing protein n=1 Tax=uncultured Dialister sp. TaxID=278064 RepID=UPI0025E10A9C|nr:LysM peptidoglycan-binding domain-containing protein [uncultured Dialister sp.]
MKKIIILMSLVVLLCGWCVNASMAGNSIQYETVTLTTNDTLWDIASKRIGKNEDIREYIFNVQQFNHITNPGQLEPGMIIKLPVNNK